MAAHSRTHPCVQAREHAHLQVHQNVHHLSTGSWESTGEWRHGELDPHRLPDRDAQYLECSREQNCADERRSTPRRSREASAGMGGRQVDLQGERELCQPTLDRWRPTAVYKKGGAKNLKSSICPNRILLCMFQILRMTPTALSNQIQTLCKPQPTFKARRRVLTTQLMLAGRLCRQMTPNWTHTS